MLELSVRHYYVKIQKSFVHLVQYGGGESIIRPACQSPSSSFVSGGSQDSSLATPASGGGHSGLLASSSSSSLSLSSSLIANKNKPTKLIIFVPGNPGVLGVYHDFLVALYKTLARPSNQSDNPVILAMSHNNFDHPDNCDYRADERICIEENELSFLERTKLDGRQNPHEIELQVMNKLIILRRLLRLDLRRAQVSDCKLVFLGHSIGCYVILRLLQDSALARLHAGSILVHPALENLATTAKGTIVHRYFTLKLDYVIRLAAYVLEKVMSKAARLSVTRWFCSAEFAESSSSVVLESMAQMGRCRTLTALIEMAKSELIHVRDLDHETMIRPLVSRLRLIYAIGDHWVNEASRLELSELYPDLYIEEQETLHAFIMDPAVVAKYAIKIGIFIQELFD